MFTEMLDLKMRYDKIEKHKFSFGRNTNRRNIDDK